jgi:translation initiation factor 1
MSEICAVCGLPKDLCVCEAIKREEQRIRIRLEKRKWGKDVTIVEGIDEKEIDLDELATKLKSKCACGGTSKEGHIELQGDHRERTRDLLVTLGFPQDNIDIE